MLMPNSEALNRKVGFSEQIKGLREIASPFLFCDRAGTVLNPPAVLGQA